MKNMRKIHFLFILSLCVFAPEVLGYEDVVNLGEYCEFEECEHILHAFCNTSDLCECEDGYLASSNNSYCLPLATKAGDPCEREEQCSKVRNAQCLNNTCVVPEALTTILPIQAKSKDECTQDSECSTYPLKRVCKDGTCVMALPSVTPIATAIDAFFLGKPCTNDSHCSSQGAACVDKLCKCTDNFVPAQNLKSCLPKARSEGDKCVENVQCLALNGSICEKEKCTQKIFKVLKSFEEKLPSLLIGSTCQTDNECQHLTHALCLENVCQCKDNYITSVSSNSCLEKAKKEGDSCEIDKQCEDIKGATCVQKKCVKPGIISTKLGVKTSSGSTHTISKLALAAILFLKMFCI